MAISPSSVAIRNRLLTALPPNVLSRLLPQLHPVSLSVRDTPFPPETAIEAVHFVETGWVSLVSALDDGAQAEVGLIGREGMVGLPLIIGVETAFEEAFVQADGTACVWKRPHFGGQCELQRLIFRYHGAMNAQTMQTAACNGRHDLEQRLARGLLMAHDRADGDTLQITQEFLAIMLCVYRPTITVAATIRYARGHLTCWIGPRWKQPRAIATPLCSAGLPACLARELSTRLRQLFREISGACGPRHTAIGVDCARVWSSRRNGLSRKS